MVQFLKSVRGVVLAGAITVVVFLGVPILAALGVIPPLTTVETAPERVAVYYWEAGTGDDDEHVELELELTPEDLEPAPEGEDVEPLEGGGEPGSASDLAPTSDEIDPDARPRGDGGTEDNDRASATVALVPSRARQRRLGKLCKPKPIPEIRKLGKDRYRVQRTIIKSYTQDFARLNGLGWSRTHRSSDGKPDGMQVGGLKCNNDLFRAGVRSGDVIHDVNGHKIRNLVQALAVYARVRRARELKVRITRRGEPRTLVYRIAG